MYVHAEERSDHLESIDLPKGRRKITRDHSQSPPTPPTDDDDSH
jgi:hypothetical protein